MNYYSNCNKKVQFSIHKGDSKAHAIRINKILSESSKSKFKPCIVSSSTVKNVFNLPNIEFYESGQRYSFGSINKLSNPQITFNQHASVEYKIYQSIKPDLLIGDTGIILHSFLENNNKFYKILNRFYLEVGGKCTSPYTYEQRLTIQKDIEELINNAREHLGLKRNFKYNDFCSKNIIINGAYNFIEDINLSNVFFSGINSNMVTNPPLNMNKNVCFLALGTGDNKEKRRSLCKTLEIATKYFNKIYVSTGCTMKLPVSLQSSSIITKETFNVLPADVGVLIIHGGYALAHIPLHTGIPAVLIPQHIEQYSNAKLLERCNLGKCIGYIADGKFNGLYQKITLNFDLLDDYFVWAKKYSNKGINFLPYDAGKSIISVVDVINFLINDDRCMQ